ncbi:MAG: class B sortase [Clostridiales bacterium]|nr:class B sortase [Clostridiales bacterium]MDU3241637.1 class B sortase [Clostridiales bacterium]
MNKRNKSAGNWIIVGIAAFLMAGICICFVVNREKQKLEAAKLYEQTAGSEAVTGEDVSESRSGKDVNQSDMGDESSTEKSTDQLRDGLSKKQADYSAELPVNIAEIQKDMPDVYGWIEIPGTKVNYPVVQREDDNLYYLDKTPDGSSNIEGSIFSEDYNRRDFTDPVTVLYGHNMKNGDMFGELHLYEDKSFFDANRDLYIYLKDKKLTYRIFAAVLFDNRHIMQSYDFSGEDSILPFIREIMNIRNMRSNVDRDISILPTDKILTLSTCHGMGSDYRYLVLGVLQND